MKKNKATDMGIFNILIVGDDPCAISLADNIHSHFLDDGSVRNKCQFNIVDDIECDAPSARWFNEFVFELSTNPCSCNIVLAKSFTKWFYRNAMCPSSSTDHEACYIESMYMKKFLQSRNTIVVELVKDLEHEHDHAEFSDIPYRVFNSGSDFLVDLYEWIDSQMDKVAGMAERIRLVKSLCGKTLPFIGDVFGCLSGKEYSGIIPTDKMRFDVPILFDEFCKLCKGRTHDEIEGSLFMRTNSSMALFFRS